MAGLASSVEITVFSVGFGDCIHINLWEDEINYQFLIDTGKQNTYKEVADSLIARKKRIDFVILTHDHLDHTSGLIKLLDDKRFQINFILLWHGDYPQIGPSHSKKLQKISNKVNDLEVVTWDVKGLIKGKIDVMPSCITVLYPDIETEYQKDLNQNSIVISITMEGGYQFLLMGDATSVEEEVILQKQMVDLTRTCLLKVGHHGSETSSYDKFLDIVISNSFKYAICSCKSGRPPEHKSPPNIETLNRIREKARCKKARLFCTGNPTHSQDIRIMAKPIMGNITMILYRGRKLNYVNRPIPMLFGTNK